LGSTVAKVLRSAQVFAKNDEEYQALEKKARQFIQGKGTELQSRLQDRAAESRNWEA